MGIGKVGKSCDFACAFKNVRQRIVIDVFKIGFGVILRLRFMNRQAMAFFLPLGFNDADGFAINKENIINRTDVRRVFAHGNSQTGIEIDCFSILHLPAGLVQHLVNFITRNLFGSLVGHIHLSLRICKSIQQLAMQYVILNT